MLNFLIIFILIIICIIFHRFLFSLPSLIYWKIKDIKKRDKDYFPYFGCWFFCGKQGAGKTVSMVHFLEYLRKKFPKLKIYTNMGYKYETAPLKGLNDLLDKSKYNGTYGTVFVLDEIQNEFSASTSRDFPESLLSMITMQRKRRILILTTSQVFSRVSKPLREQCFRVIECHTMFGRYTRCKHYDGQEYADSFDKGLEYKRLNRPRLSYESFVQTDELRDCFDSFKLIERLSRDGFSPKIPTNNSTTHVNVKFQKR